MRGNSGPVPTLFPLFTYDIVMSSHSNCAVPDRENFVPSIYRLQWITIAWMCVELSVAAVAGVRACSIALTAFAADSAIELSSAIVVLGRFHFGPSAEKKAARTNSVLLCILAAYIVAGSAASLESRRLRPQPSYLGIALLLAAGIIMPWLGRAKRRLANHTGSRALRADAAQSAVCAWMSWIALAGVVLNATFHLAWTDSVAALLLVPFIVHEAREAWRGNVCCC